MGSQLIKANGKRRQTSPKRLDVRHRAWADEFMSNGMNQTAAAKVLKYKHPKIAASKLLRNPLVQDYLQTELRKLNYGQEIRRAQLIAKLERVVDFNLMKAVSTSKGAFLEISPEKYDEVADEIGDCVTEVEFNTTEDRDGNTKSTVRVKLMSMERMFELELKYRGMLALEGGVTINNTVESTPKRDWDDLYGREEDPSNVVDGSVVEK